MSQEKLRVKAFPVRKLENGVPRFIGYFPFLVNERGTVRGHAMSPYDEDGREYGKIYPTADAAMKAYADHLALEVSLEATRKALGEQQEVGGSPSPN